MKALLASTILAVLLLGCSSKGGPQPTPLAEDFQATVELQRDWFYVHGDGRTVDRYQQLQPVAVNDRVYSAGRDGQLRLLNLATGKVELSLELGEEISGGLSVHLDSEQPILMVGTGNGELVVLDLVGTEQWRADLTSRMVSPAVADDASIYVQTQDGKLVSLDRNTGQQQWFYDSGIPRLTVMGTASPKLSGNQVVTGFGNGKLVSLNTNNGQVLWEHRVAEGKGRTDLERLVDLDAPPTLIEGMVLASGLNGDTIAVSLQNGRVLTQMPHASNHPVIPANQQFNFVLQDDAVIAVDPKNQEEVWRQTGLVNRGLTHAVAWQGYLAVADREGWLHLLDLETGALAARRQVDYKGVATSPVVAGEQLLVQGRSGRVKAYSIK